MPRFDSESCFGRLLDWNQGGYWTIAPAAPRFEVARRYLDGTLVLETTFRTPEGEARLVDFFAMRRGGREFPHRQLVRIVEGVAGRVELCLCIAPRFDYGAVRPWIRRYGPSLYGAMGGDDGLVITSNARLDMPDKHTLAGSFSIAAGERIRVGMYFRHPEHVDAEARRIPPAEQLDQRLDETVAWWRHWSARGKWQGPDAPAIQRSATVLKALTNAPSGAMVAAPTTSLPESPGGSRNWDYRYSWIRDSSFAVHALAALGYHSEANRFRQFVQRSAAGSADQLQLMYGVGGERRLTELELSELEGYRGARPVRIGNAASRQVQLDAYGDFLELAWRAQRRGHDIDRDFWHFMIELVNLAAQRWREPDHGIWEMRSAPRHFVHSKVMCWVALDRGIRLAQENKLEAPLAPWNAVRDEIRQAIETDGYDPQRGTFVQAFGYPELDAALLLLPHADFVAFDDPRMVRTTEAIGRELCEDGLVMRYRSHDGIPESEGTFLPCTFWLAECLARQHRAAEARAAFERAAATANDLGLFAEEFDPRSGEMLGNFPQGLTHLAHICAALGLADG
jgi:GH15 family glucan-1,4-alpha-glucosidase